MRVPAALARAGTAGRTIREGGGRLARGHGGGTGNHELDSPVCNPQFSGKHCPRSEPACPGPHRERGARRFRAQDARRRAKLRRLWRRLRPGGARPSRRALASSCKGRLPPRPVTDEQQRQRPQPVLPGLSRRNLGRRRKGRRYMSRDRPGRCRWWATRSAMRSDCSTRSSRAMRWISPSSVSEIDASAAPSANRQRISASFSS